MNTSLKHRKTTFWSKKGFGIKRFNFISLKRGSSTNKLPLFLFKKDILNCKTNYKNREKA